MNTIIAALLPAVAGPIITAIVKWAMGKYGATMPPLAKIALSAAAGAVTAVTTGDTTTLAATATDVVSGAIAGAGGSKFRDIVVGKAGSCAPGAGVPGLSDSSTPSE